MLTQKKESSWRRGVEKGLRNWWHTLEARAMDSAEPLNPQRVFWELSPRLPDNAIITADSGSVANWYARDLKTRRGMKASLSGGLASLSAAHLTRSRECTIREQGGLLLPRDDA